MGGERWHALEPEDVLARLRSGAEGLSAAEARRRLAAHGPNALAVAPPVPAWRILADQARSAIVALLVVAAAVSVAIGDLVEAAAIGAVLGIDLAIGFTTEWRARRTMEALSRLSLQEARVLRGGAAVAADARELVPGDVVLLEAGDAVPADLRLVAAAELAAGEAALTGESLPVEKAVAAVAPDAVLSERASLVFKGTLVVRGSGRGVVVATGRETEVGRVAELVGAVAEEPTPLERRLARLGRRLIVATLGVAALVIGLGLARGGAPWLMVETGIALAVAAVPEGLPVVAVVTLAIGMRRMARERALVRRLVAVEALGSVTIVCSDKTGTLTAGEMTAVVVRTPAREIEVEGAGYAPEGDLHVAGEAVELAADPALADLLRAAALANRSEVTREGSAAWSAVGDPTEAALLVLARKGGVDRAAELARAPETAELPFSSARRLMATVHRAADGAGVEVFCKGAPHAVLERCATWRVGAEERALGAAERTAVEGWNDELAARGLRVLALAHGRRPAGPAGAGGAEAADEAVSDLAFLGLVGLLDPPAEGVVETVAALARAGVRTVMITGDQAPTARAVARELGLAPAGADAGAGLVLDGRELAALDDAALAARLDRVVAFSRMAPEDKLRVVRAFQARGESVGMLGDGVNDAAALKGADVGVAMGGRGTDVAKETADVVLADDRFATIGVAVAGGRTIFDDIEKFVFYLFSGNLAEVLVMLVAGLLGWPLPLRPLQILWINLVTDVFPALALAVEPAEPDVLRRPPRDPARPLFSRRMLVSCALHAAAITAVTLLAFRLELAAGDGERAVSTAFLVLGLAQVLHALNARSARPIVASRRLFTNGWMWAALGLSAALVVGTTLVPGLVRVLETVPPSAAEWAWIAALAAVPLALGQLGRAVARRGRA